MSDPRPPNLLSANEVFYAIERARRTPFKHVIEILQRAASTINYYEERLEVRAKDGKLLSESADGIACRDETILQQDARITKLQTLVNSIKDMNDQAN